MSKFYYDVCIDYDPDHTEEGQEGKMSRVEKNWYLEQPLLEQPGDYNLSVSKFSINTESLPVFIPELLQPHLTNNLNNGFLQTNYSLYIKINYEETTKMGKSNKTFYKGQFIYFEGEKYKTFERLGNPYLIGDQEYVFLNNLNRDCFVYSYSDFIQTIQENIEKLTSEFHGQLTEENQKYFASNLIRIALVDNKIRIQFHNNLKTAVINRVKVNSYEIGFSENLYRYIGMGFRSKRGEYEGTEPRLKNRKYWKIDNTCYKYFYSVNDSYSSIQQDFSTLLNWNPLKAIIIGTDTLPVVEEFLPIAHYDGFLVHYKSQTYLNYLSRNGLNFDNGDNDVFKRNSLKILDVYYPLTSDPGDIKSTCILSRDNIDLGQTIELLPASPITRFNVWVKWIDIFGNLHDLYQGPDCCTDIRFCFTKKPILKEDLDVASTNIIENLAPPESKKARTEPFLKQVTKNMHRSNGKPNGIDLEGADNYGWIHL